MTKNYNAYFFDWDGTLCQSLQVWIPLLRQKFQERYDIELTDRQLGSCLGDWNYIYSLGVPKAEELQFRHEAETAAYGKYVMTDLYDHVKPLLSDLRHRNKKTALITSSKRRPIEETLAHHGLADLFDLIVSADDVREHKPDPEGILFALDHFGLRKDQAVMLGDTDKDLGAARNAGVDSILFYPVSHEPFYDKAHLLSFAPVQIVSTWRDLVDHTTDALATT